MPSLVWNSRRGGINLNHHNIHCPYVEFTWVGHCVTVTCIEEARYEICFLEFWIQFISKKSEGDKPSELKEGRTSHNCKCNSWIYYSNKSFRIYIFLRTGSFSLPQNSEERSPNFEKHVVSILLHVFHQTVRDAALKVTSVFLTNLQSHFCLSTWWTLVFWVWKNYLFLNWCWICVITCPICACLCVSPGPVEPWGGLVLAHSGPRSLRWVWTWVVWVWRPSLHPLHQRLHRQAKGGEIQSPYELSIKQSHAGISWFPPPSHH